MSYTELRNKTERTSLLDNAKCYSNCGPATWTFTCVGEMNFSHVLKKNKNTNINNPQQQTLSGGFEGKVEGTEHRA